MKVNIYLTSDFHSFYRLGDQICIKRNVPLCRDSRYFLSKKSLFLLNNVIKRVISAMKVNLFQKPHFHSLFSPFTESITQFVKRRIWFSVGILNTFFVGNLLGSWIIFQKVFSDMEVNI